MAASAPRTPRPSVLMIGSEALPFSKSGGLADVLGALPPALARLGWDVTLFTPRYRGVTAGTFADRFGFAVGGHYADVSIFESSLGDGARVMLVDEPSLFDREHYYGGANWEYPDNPRRFAVLTRAALEWASRQPTPTAIVHAHDWQAGLAPVYLRSMYRHHPALADTRSVFTIHNLAYQGRFRKDWMPQLDLGWDLFTIDCLEFFDGINLLKGGIAEADMVSTVSPQYAKEIQTGEGGVGLDGVLRAKADRLVGILNGIDVGQWNPASDPHLPQPYRATNLAGKRAAKRAVLERYGLPTDDATLERPLIGMISRMVDQKGLDLIERLAHEWPHLDVSVVILGTGEPRYQDMWRWLASTRPHQIGVRIGFDEGLAHLIEAGADMFLMPSLFEPCGLNQMYSLRYGTVPIVRRVGGLADTVVDFEPGNPASNGFVFTDYSPWVLLETIRRALSVYWDRDTWRALQTSGMQLDLSWDRSAREYVRMFEYAISKGRP